MSYYELVGSIKLRILSAILLVTLVALVTPIEALAVVKSLNGQKGKTQTFQNDTNVTISSSSNTHSVGWQGLLDISRGGTGASSFSAGSLLFSNGTSISQDNSNLFWDNINKRLGIGTIAPSAPLSVTGEVTASHFTGTTTATTTFMGNVGIGTAENLDNIDGLSLNILADATKFDTGLMIGDSANSNGVEILWSGSGVDPEGLGFGYVSTFSSGADLYLTGRNVIMQNASGKVGIGTTNPAAKLDVAGTISGDSTMFLGSSTSPGCIVMGDSDGSGITYVTANDGVLTASTTKPSVCQ